MTTVDHTAAWPDDADQFMDVSDAPDIDKENVGRVWTHFLAGLREKYPPGFSFLERASVGSVRDGWIEIHLGSDLAVKMLGRGEPQRIVEEAMSSCLGVPVRLAFVKKKDSWKPKSLLEVEEEQKAKKVEAFDAEVALRPHVREVVQEYRSILDKHEYGFCPVCGQRTAIKSNGDLGVGPTVQIYCNSGDCPAREIDVTVKRGYMWRPLEWDSQPSRQTTSRQRVAEEKKRRPNQHVWRKMWRARHGGTLICNLCGVTESDAQIQIDHIVELRDGGEDADWNTQPLCVECHRRKTSARSRR